MAEKYIKQSDAEAETRMRNEYAAKFGMINILSDEEKAKYSTFAQRVHNLNHKDLFKLNMGIADELTSEQKDIVAYEIKIKTVGIATKPAIIRPAIAFPSECFFVKPTIPKIIAKVIIIKFNHGAHQNTKEQRPNTNDATQNPFPGADGAGCLY